MQTKCLFCRAIKYARTSHFFSSSRHVDVQAPVPILRLSRQLVGDSSPHTTHTIEPFRRNFTSQYERGTSDNGKGCEYGHEHGLKNSSEKSTRRLECYQNGTYCELARGDDQKPLSSPHRSFLLNRSENGGTELRSLRRYPTFPRSNRNKPSLNQSAECRRLLHSTSYPTPATAEGPLSSLALQLQDENRGPIRKHLETWQAQYLQENPQMLHQVPGFGMVPRAENVFVSMKGVEELEPDPETDTVDSDEELYETAEFSNQRFPRKGDLVHMKAGGDSAEGIFAVYLRPNVLVSELYTIRGTHVVAKAGRIKFVSRDTVPHNLIDEVLRFLPEQDVSNGNGAFQASVVPSQIGSPLIDIMTRYSEECFEVYRKNASKLDNAHQLLADEFEEKHVTLEDLAVTLLGKPTEELSEPAFCAIDLSIRRTSYAILKVGHIFSHDVPYLVHSKRYMRATEAVVSWVRQYQEALATPAQPSPGEVSKPKPIVHFVAKAQRLIFKSRKIRSPTVNGGLGISWKRYTPEETDDGLVYKRIPGEFFSETDRMIIAFLHSWIGTRSMTAMGHLKAAATTILRAVDRYDHVQLAPEIGRVFLQEIGAYSPWEDITIFAIGSELPGHGLSVKSDRLLQEAQSLSRHLDTLELVDSMQDLRKDWGDLSVFCIDDAWASEIDDGISLEAVPGSDDRFWIHVHVANPSAFLRPDDPFARHAASMVQSLYLPTITYPMFPSELTQGRFSLAPNRPVITFSAMLNREGDILDHKITPGVIRNVVTLSPQKVHEITGLSAYFRYPSPTITVGGKMPEESVSEQQDPLSEVQQQAIITLEELRRAHFEKRRENARNLGYVEALGSLKTVAAVRVYAGRTSVPRSVMDFRQSFHFQGDPIIQIGGPSTLDISNEEASLVNTIMVLAGEVGARWCAERNIPLIYRGCAFHPDTIVSEDGEGDNAQQAPKNLMSSTPQQHVILGVKSYCKCTSPLRRYSDLLSHWQIEAALREEAHLGKSLLGSQDISYLPLSAKEVEKSLRWIVPKENSRSNVAHYSHVHWLSQFLLRAVHFTETSLPRTFYVVLTYDVGSGPKFMTPVGSLSFKGYVLPWHFRVGVLAPKDGIEDWNVGDLIEAEIKHVDVHNYNTFVTPIRVVQKAEEGKAASQILAHKRYWDFVYSRVAETLGEEGVQ